MARESAMSKWIDCGIGTKEEFLERWNKGGESREQLWRHIGYANEGACYNAARNLGIIAGGPVSNGNKNNDSDGDGKKAPRKQRKGVLPIEVERWVRAGLVADWIFAGNASDEYEEPAEITPEVFLSHRPVFDETAAYRKILARIGGLDSDAGKSLRAWAGRPLTAVQAEQESAERETAAAATILPKIAKLLNKARELADKSGLEIGDEIAALMTIHGLVAEEETE